MTRLEIIGLIGSIASIIGLITAIPVFIEFIIRTYLYIRGKYLYNKIIKANPMDLTNFYRKANRKKRQHYREQAKKLKEDIGQVPKDKLNQGEVIEVLMNMVDNLEQLDKENND